jgi:hypothetical protein
VNWNHGAPPTPGVYRVIEPRAAVWYSRWTGRHWCLGSDSLAEAAAETEPRGRPPDGWRPARKREHDRAAVAGLRLSPAAKPLRPDFESLNAVPWLGTMKP